MNIIVISVNIDYVRQASLWVLIGKSISFDVKDLRVTKRWGAYALHLFL